jgi:hypothetical protein
MFSSMLLQTNDLLMEASAVLNISLGPDRDCHCENDKTFSLDDISGVGGTLFILIKEFFLFVRGVIS